MVGYMAEARNARVLRSLTCLNHCSNTEAEQRPALSELERRWILVSIATVHGKINPYYIDSNTSSSCQMHSPSAGGDDTLDDSIAIS